MGVFAFLGGLNIKSETPLAFAIVSSVLFFSFLFIIPIGYVLDFIGID